MPRSTVDIPTCKYIRTVCKRGHGCSHTVYGDKGTVSKALTDEGWRRDSLWAFALENALRTALRTGTQTTKVDINMELSHYRPDSTSGKSFFSFSPRCLSVTGVTAAVGSSRHHKATLILLPSKEASAYLWQPC